MRATLITILVLILATQSAIAEPAPEKTLPIKGEVFSIDGHPAFLISPPQKPEAGKPTPWILYAPTLKGLPGKEETWMFQKFLDAGIAIAGIDIGESYGSPTGVNLYTKLYDRLVNQESADTQHTVSKHSMAPKITLLARSRGGLMLYNWAAKNPNKIACIVGIYPICDLRSYPGLKKAAPAYRLTELQLQKQLSDYNPIDNLRPLAQANIPIFHIHGDSDTVVPLEQNSAELARRYQKSGGKITLEIVKGRGHDMWPGWFQSQTLVDFIIKQAENGNNSEPTQ
jgi:pimeloyl-ACP methyl ester carboxylesterase